MFAFQFLTVIPFRFNDEPGKDTVSGSVTYFPLVGMTLGLALFGLNKLLVLAGLNSFLTSAIIVVTLALVTGGLHLDGLADTFDALGSHKDKGKMLEIMRDSHIGVMGAVSLMSILILKIAALSSLPPETRGAGLIAACIGSRWAMTLSIWLFPYARQEGKGKDFFQGMDHKKLMVASVFALAGVFMFCGLKSLLGLAAAGVFAYAFSRRLTGKIGGITGDNLGAINEISEVLILVTVVILAGGV